MRKNNFMLSCKMKHFTTLVLLNLILFASSFFFVQPIQAQYCVGIYTCQYFLCCDYEPGCIAAEGQCFEDYSVYCSQFSSQEACEVNHGTAEIACPPDIPISGGCDWIPTGPNPTPPPSGPPPPPPMNCGTYCGDDSDCEGGATCTYKWQYGGDVCWGSGCTTCFLADTQVKMADGKQKNIQDVTPGEEVLSFDKQGGLSANQVLAVDSLSSQGYYKITTADGTILKVTRNHPLFFKNENYMGWGSFDPTFTLAADGMWVKRIKLGNYLLKDNKDWSQITDLQYINEAVPVFNLKSVENSNSFFANGFYVHNKGEPGDITTCAGTNITNKWAPGETRDVYVSFYREFTSGGAWSGPNIRTWQAHPYYDETPDGGNQANYDWQCQLLDDSLCGKDNHVWDTESDGIWNEAMDFDYNYNLSVEGPASSDNSVEQGDTVTFNFKLTAPVTPGSYYDQDWGMLTKHPERSQRYFTHHDVSCGPSTITVETGPTGAVEQALCTTNGIKIVGWAGDVDDPTLPVDVKVYVDGDIGVGQLVDLGNATYQRNQAICEAIDINYPQDCAACPSANPQCEHGINATLTTAGAIDLMDGNYHTYYVYAINLPATGGTDTLLMGSPFTIACANQTPVGSHDWSVGLQTQASCLVGGWAADPDNLGSDVNYRVINETAGGTEIFSGVASDYRADLDTAGVCTGGTCAFSTNVWGLITQGVATSLRVEAEDLSGGWYPVSNTPKTMTCGDSCGDLSCTGLETCASCPTDCGACPSSWFQVRGGDTGALATAGSAIVSLVPDSSICVEPDCIPVLSAPDDNLNLDSDGFPITGGGVIDVNGRISYRANNTFVVGSSPTHFRENYAYFYTLYSLGTSPTDDFVGQASDAQKPVAVQDYYFHSGDMTIQSAWNVASGESYVIFVDGNLTISDPGSAGELIKVADGGFLAFIVSGNITITDDVGHTTLTNIAGNVEGIYIADGTLTVNSNAGLDKKFIGEGTFAGWTNVVLSRDYNAGPENGQYPTETFIFRPDLVKNTPSLMKRSQMIWQEVN